jgi:hypothetical protein
MTTDRGVRKYASDIKGAFNSAWAAITLAEPKAVQIIVVSGQDGTKVGLHDRWWLADDAGLSIGTSLGGLGDSLSEIHELDRASCDRVRRELDGFLRLDRRAQAGAQLSYEAFCLELGGRRE